MAADRGLSGRRRKGPNEVAALENEVAALELVVLDPRSRRFVLTRSRTKQLIR
jgi:hypothetical protein